MKDGTDALTDAWDTVTKDTIPAWNGCWPMTVFSDDDEQGGN